LTVKRGQGKTLKITRKKGSTSPGSGQTANWTRIGRRKKKRGARDLSSRERKPEERRTSFFKIKMLRAELALVAEEHPGSRGED